MNKLEQLTNRADESAPGLEANQLLWDCRAAAVERFGRASVYELVAEKCDDMYEDVARRLIPRLIRLLRAREIKVPGAPEILVPLWLDDQVYVFSAPVLFETIAELEATTVDQLEVTLAGGAALAVVPLPPSQDGSD